MPKLKTSKSAKKRIKISKRGKATYVRAGRGHLLTSKRAKRKRHMKRRGLVFRGELQSIRKLLPYGS